MLSKYSLAALAAFAVSVHAEINTCKNANGKTYFTDKPCPESYQLQSSRLSDVEQRQIERQQRKQTAQTQRQAALKEQVAARKAEINRWHKYEGGEHGLFNDVSTSYVPAVERVLKNTLRDPDSLQMINCSPVLTNGSSYRVRCAYRAKNGFGGYVSSDEVFRFNADGEFVRVSEYTGKHLAFE